MRGGTRRAFLTACGAGFAGLAGCSALPGSDDDSEERRRYDRDELSDAVGPLEDLVAPDAFPVSVPAAARERHAARARAYLDEVPAEPAFPNEAIAEKLAERRSDAATSLEDEAAGGPLARLETWRDRREAAASVRGAFLAATDELESEDVADVTGEARSALAGFEASWEYRGSDAVSATVVHAALEDLAESARGRLAAQPSFPPDPGAAVFEAGETLGDLDRARAAVADAERVRERYRSGTDGADTYRSRITGAGNRLRGSLNRTIEDVRPHVDGDPSALDIDVEDAPAAVLYRDAARQVEWGRESAERARRAHRPATAALRTGRALVASEVLEAVVEAIEDGRFSEDPTIEWIEVARDAALDALRTAWESEPRALAVELAMPAFQSVTGVTDHVERGYADADRTLATLVRAEVHAHLVPAATRFVAERLRGDAAGR